MSATVLSAELIAKREHLLDMLRGYRACVVAFSAGVDSTVVAQAAHLALGERAVAVTGVSASLAAGELDEARRLAQQIGIRHEVIQTQELSDPDYLKNAPDRCFHCKTELYTQLEDVVRQFAARWTGDASSDSIVIVNGANVDDRGDYRPGMLAAQEHAVRSPLAECDLTKAEVRQLAADWNLSVWDKPATPCLSSRVAYGEPVTPERLAMIDRAEQYLRAQGLRTLRVRYHAGDLARVEVPPEAIDRLAQPAVRAALVAELKALGFKFVTLDLEGFRSGSHNAVLQIAPLS